MRCAVALHFSAEYCLPGGLPPRKHLQLRRLLSAMQSVLESQVCSVHGKAGAMRLGARMCAPLPDLTHFYVWS
jgi:hypothetical protein